MSMDGGMFESLVSRGWDGMYFAVLCPQARPLSAAVFLVLAHINASVVTISVLFVVVIIAGIVVAIVTAVIIAVFMAAIVIAIMAVIVVAIVVVIIAVLLRLW